MKAVLVDLDDTLYNELEYVYSGFREVAKTISSYTKLCRHDVYNRMIYQFTKYGRIGVFDAVKEYFNIVEPDTETLVNVYRGHEPDISLAWKVEEALQTLRKYLLVAVVTDGHPIVQRKKIAALELDKMVDEIVYCMDTKEPKPSPLPYLDAVEKLGVDIADCVIIGDDPYCDMLAAKHLGIDSYRILYGKHMRVKSLSEATPVLDCGSFIMAAHNILLEKVK